MNAINVNTKAFTRELEWCARFIERKTTIPILSNVLLRKSGELLYFTGTDLELGGQTSIEADGPDFELTVPVHLLLKYLKKVEERDLQLIPRVTYHALPYGPHVEGCDGGPTEGCCRGEIGGVRLSVRHGEDGAVDIDGMKIDSYPEVPSCPLASIEIGGLETAIPRAIVAICTEETRFNLTGALLRIDGRSAQLISTDGHRLSVAEAKVIEWHEKKPTPKIQALIPKAALVELGRLGDSAFFCSDEHHAFFTVGDRTIVTRKLTGTFPDWERVLPAEFRYSVSVASAPLKKVIDRVALFADDRSHCIELSVNGTLKIVANQCEHSASGQVPFVGPTFAYPYVAGFNASYLTDFLKTANATDFHFCFNKGERSPAECSVDGWRYVVMTMRNGDNADPVEEGEVEPAPAVIAYLEAQANEPMPAPTDTTLCPCDVTWERAGLLDPAAEPAVELAEPEVAPEPALSSRSVKRAEQLRAAATAIQKHIDAKHQSATNMLALPPTRKRTQDGEGIRKDAVGMEKLQRVLHKLADLHDAGTCPPELLTVTSRAAVERLRFTEGPIRTMIAEAERPETPAEKLAKLERAVLLRKIPGFFPSRPSAISQMMAIAELTADMTVLEPSAGTGRIADAAREAGALVDVVEINESLREILREKGHTLLPEKNFLELDSGSGLYDRVLMNPPFENHQDIDHVVHAYKLLKPGGLLVAMTSPAWGFRDSRKAEEFRAWFGGIGGTKTTLPSGSFDLTGCPGVLISISKPPAAEPAEPAAVCEPVESIAVPAPATQGCYRIRCVTCNQDLGSSAFEVRWDTKKLRRSCRSCRKQPRSVTATLQAAVA